MYYDGVVNRYVSINAMAQEVFLLQLGGTLINLAIKCYCVLLCVMVRIP